MVTRPRSEKQLCTLFSLNEQNIRDCFRRRVHPGLRIFPLRQVPVPIQILSFHSGFGPQRIWIDRAYGSRADSRSTTPDDVLFWKRYHQPCVD